MGPDVPPGTLIAGAASSAAEPDAAQPVPGRWRELVEVVLVAVIAALFVRTFLFQAFVVPSGSMEPTVLVGDHLLVNKFAFAPHGRAFSAILPYRPVRRGDVIVFKFPEDPSRDFIKRVVAVPDDTVEVRDRRVFVNGVLDQRSERESRAASPPGRRAPGSWMGATRVPRDASFAMGDNRDSSYDSRFWGPVPAANLKGRALFVYWSLAPPSSGPSNGMARLFDLPRRTRWARFFHPVR